MVWRYENEISHIFYNGKKLKTSEKLLKIPDIRPPWLKSSLLNDPVYSFNQRHVFIVQTITHPTDLDLCQCPMIMIVTLKRDVSMVTCPVSRGVTCPVSLHKWSRVRWSLSIPHHVQWTHGDSRTMGTLHSGQAGARCQAFHKADADC